MWSDKSCGSRSYVEKMVIVEKVDIDKWFYDELSAWDTTKNKLSIG